MIKNENIDTALGIAPAVDGEIISANQAETSLSLGGEIGLTDEAESDFKYARENFYDVIEKGSQALEEILQVAKSSESPRAFEVVSTLIKTISDTSKELVNLSNKKQEAQKTNTDSDVTINNNSIFVGSTKELQELIEKSKR